MVRAVLLIAVLALTFASPASAGMPRPAFVERDGSTVCPPDASGCADPAAGIVYLVGAGRFARAHEIGHVFDRQALTDRERAWLMPQLGFPIGTDWYGEVGNGKTSPSERFADAYASCHLGYSPFGRRGRWVDSYGYAPRSPHALLRVCNAIAVAGLVAAYRPS